MEAKDDGAVSPAKWTSTLPVGEGVTDEGACFGLMIIVVWKGSEKPIKKTEPKKRRALDLRSINASLNKINNQKNRSGDGSDEISTSSEDASSMSDGSSSSSSVGKSKKLVGCCIKNGLLSYGKTGLIYLCCLYLLTSHIYFRNPSPQAPQVLLQASSPS